MDSNKEYSIFLHIFEGSGFIEKCKEIWINAILNGVKFEIEGHSTENTVVFNSNCIWECMYEDLKRMRADNRPIKIECYHKVLKNNAEVKKAIGFILLPIRNLQTVKTLRNLQIKLHWHKLSGLCGEWRKTRPEIYLSAIITTKELMQAGQLEDFLEPKPVDSSHSVYIRPSETSLMLSSQHGLYIKLMEEECLLQVGDSPDDCDTFLVTLTLKKAKNLEQLVGPGENENPVFVFHYDFFGGPADLILAPNSDKVYSIQEKISVNFRSSLPKLEEYFKRVFYIPIDLYYNDSIIGNYKFKCADLMPSSLFAFDDDKNWEVQDSFTLQTLFDIFETSSRPTVDFVFSVSHIPFCSPIREHQVPSPTEVDKRARGDMRDSQEDFFKTLDLAPSNPSSEDESESKSKTRRFKRPKEKTPKLTSDASVDCNIQDPDRCADDMAYKIVAELEDWKQEQMNDFLVELKRKEVNHLSQLSLEWERQKKEMMQTLQDKLDECTRLTESLEAAHGVVRARSLKQFDMERAFEKTKYELDKHYTVRFMEIEEKARRIKDEMDYELKLQELRFKEVEMKNKLEVEENVRLSERVKQLEEELDKVKKNSLPKEQLSGLIEDLRTQSERCTELEKSKKFYKDQWAKLTKEMQRQRLHTLKLQEERLKNSSFISSGNMVDFKQLIIGEHEALKSDRNELRRIKDALTSESDSSRSSETD